MGCSVLNALTSLDLSGNEIGYRDDNNTAGTIAFGEGIGKLNALTSLDLSGNKIGWNDSDASGTVALGEGIGNLNALISLDLSGNEIGSGDGSNASGTVALGEGIGRLSGLEILNLANNKLEWELSITTLAHALNATRNLTILNLGGNSIGTMGSGGPAVLLSVLPNLPHLNLGACNFQGMTNISWTKSVHDLQKLRSQAMAEACQSSKCFGGDVTTNNNGNVQSSVVSTSSTARRLMSLEAVYPVEACVCTTNVNGVETCACPHVTSQQMVVPETEMLSTLGTSAVTGLMYAALPEALGDALYLSGTVSATNANRVKWATNATFILASGSWMSAGASWLTSAGLQYAGVSESRARVGGNAMAFLVNAGRHLSPTVAAATAANYAAGRVGLWAEKKMMQRIYAPSN